MKIVNLIENRSCDNTIKCEHGLSMYIETGEYSVLFDVGQSDKFLENAQLMGIDLTAIDYVILSHGHYDHTGGLPAFLEKNTKAIVLMHKEALKERFSRSEKMIKSNGIPWRETWEAYRHRIRFVDNTFELVNGLWIVSGLSGDGTYSSLDQRLVFKDGHQLKKDPFNDELALFVYHPGGNALLTGCAHNGIVNILNALNQQLQVQSYRFIAGGLHLNGQPEEKIVQVIDELKKFKVEQWGLNHCTGDLAIDLFKKAYPAEVSYFKGGDSYNF